MVTAEYVHVSVRPDQILELQAWLDEETPGWYHHIHRSHHAGSEPFDEQKFRAHNRQMYVNMARAQTMQPQSITLAFEQIDDAQLVKLRLCWNGKRCKIV